MLLTAEGAARRGAVADRGRRGRTTLRGNLCRCTGYRKIVDAILACARDGPRESARAARSASSADPVRRARRAGQGHGTRALRHRPEPARHAARRAAALAPRARADRAARSTRAPRAPCPASTPWSPRPTSTGATRTTAPRSATGRSSPSTSCATRASRWPPRSPRTRPRPARRSTRIDVEYEPLPAVTTLEEALAPGAPLVHTGEPLAGHFADLSTLRPDRRHQRLPPVRLRARARRRRPSPRPTWSLEDTYTLPARPALLDGAARARSPPGTSEGGLTVWAATQNPYSVRVELAKMFRLPLPAASASSCRSSAAASAARPTRSSSRWRARSARVAGRPVRLALSAEDAFRTVRRCDARVTRASSG